MGVLKEGRLRDIYVPLIFLMLILAGSVFADRIGPKNLFVAINTGNTAPVVYNSTVLNGTGSPIGTVTLADSSKTQITINFSVYDADGTANIANANTGVNITFNNVKRSNNSGNCAQGDVSSTVRSFNCTVVFYYYDNSSTLWEINLSTADNAGALAHNDSQTSGNAAGGAGHNLTLSSLSAFTLQTTSVATSANIGDTNKELSFVLNNTGNFDFTKLNVTPFDLNASLTDFFKIDGNFSINASISSGGLGVPLIAANASNINDSQGLATMPHKITSAEADFKANRTVFIYVDVPSNKGLSSGVTYNVSPALPWQLWAE